MNRIDGMPTEFEWKYSLESQRWASSRRKIQSLMRDLQCEPEHLNDRIIFMSRYNDIAWQEKGNKEMCVYNSQTVANYARKFPRDHWSFLVHGSEERRYGTYTDKPDGSWDQTAENMMASSSESGHPILRASSASERGELRSKGGGKKSVHFNGSDENIELLLRTVISANQLSVYGAVADLCNEQSESSRAAVRFAALDHLETMEILLKKLRPMHSNGETWCKNTSENSNNRPKTRNYPTGLKLVEKGQYFYTLDIQKKDKRCNIFAENTQCLETKRRLERKDGFSRIRETVQS